MDENLFRQLLVISHGQKPEAEQPGMDSLWIYQWFHLNFFYIILLLSTTNKLICYKFFSQYNFVRLIDPLPTISPEWLQLQD